MTGPDGRLLSYSFPRALGAYILRALDRAERESLNLGYAINEVLTYVTACYRISVYSIMAVSIS